MTEPPRQSESILDDVLWGMAILALTTGILILATTAELGKIDDIAVGIIWITLGVPFLVMAIAHALYILMRWVITPLCERRRRGLELRRRSRAATLRDIVMVASSVGWVSAVLVDRM